MRQSHASLTYVARLSPEENQRIFALTKELKDKFQEGIREPVLAGPRAGAAVRKAVAADARQLRVGDGPSGRQHAVSWSGCRLGQARSGYDFPQVLSQYVDVVVCRCPNHAQAGRAGQVLHLPGDQRPDRSSRIPARRWPIFTRSTKFTGRSKASGWPTSATPTTSPAAWR